MTRCLILIPRFVLIVAGLAMFTPAWLVADEGDVMPEQTQQFFVQLLGTRDGWPNDMTPDEERIMTEHFYYLQDLVKQKKVVTAGPVFDPVFGLIIVDASSEAEARELIEKDPSVTNGLHTFEIHPMRVSLLKENCPEDRYVQEPTARRLTKEIVVDALISEVFSTWTTTAGVKTFFASDAMVELRPGGPYEIYFDTEQPYGLQGSEGCRFLSYLPSTMLSFEWNAPPSFGTLRGIHTQVVVILRELDTGETQVTLTHYGWGEGEDWNRLYNYFDRAWGLVLSNLKKRFAEGPIDWSAQ